MGSKITLDRETFKALAADTRVEILKRIGEHRLTLTDLSQKMGMSPSTIKEHLDRLVDAGLIEAEDRGTKWKYYRLTLKGENIVSPVETKVWILLGVSFLAFLGSGFSIVSDIAEKLTPLNMLSQKAAPEMELAAAPAESLAHLSKAAYHAQDLVNQTVNASGAAVRTASDEVKRAGPSRLLEGSPQMLEAAKNYAADKASDAGSVLGDKAEGAAAVVNASAQYAKKAAEEAVNASAQYAKKAVGDTVNTVSTTLSEPTRHLLTTSTTLGRQIQESASYLGSLDPILLINIGLFLISGLGILIVGAHIAKRKRYFGH